MLQVDWGLSHAQKRAMLVGQRLTHTTLTGSKLPLGVWLRRLSSVDEDHRLGEEQKGGQRETALGSGPQACEPGARAIPFVACAPARRLVLSPPKLAACSRWRYGGPIGLNATQPESRSDNGGEIGPAVSSPD